MAYCDSPIDRAHSVAHALHAIDDLLCVALDAGSREMHLANPNYLATLIGWLCRELDDALSELDKPTKERAVCSA